MAKSLPVAETRVGGPTATRERPSPDWTSRNSPSGTNSNSRGAVKSRKGVRSLIGSLRELLGASSRPQCQFQALLFGSSCDLFFSSVRATENRGPNAINVKRDKRQIRSGSKSLSVINCSAAGCARRAEAFLWYVRYRLINKPSIIYN